MLSFFLSPPSLLIHLYFLLSVTLFDFSFSFILSLSLSLFVYPLFSTFSSAPQTVMIINVTSSHFCLHLYLPASLLLYFYLFTHNPLLLTWSILSLCTPILIPFSFPLFLFYFILAFHFRLPVLSMSVLTVLLNSIRTVSLIFKHRNDWNELDWGV